MQTQPISIAEAAGHNGANRSCRITHADLTEAAANTAQTLTVFSLVPSGDAIVGLTNFDCRFKGFELVEKFQDTTDTAHNDDQIIVGDSVDDDQFLAATQVNVNGTEILRGTGISDAITVAATSVTCKFTPAGGKNLAALNKGIVDLFFYVADGAL